MYQSAFFAREVRLARATEPASSGATRAERAAHVSGQRSVRYWSKEINGTLTGGQKKYIFLIRGIDDAAMAAAPAESCRFVVLRSPWGRLGSVLYTCNRLQRMRGRFRQ